MVERVVKFVGFVPVDHLESVRDAVFTAGAGHIGGYDRCSWSTLGTGTFRGGADAHPAIGVTGVFEQVSELRFETVCLESVVDAVCAAFIRAHPYEEPAYEVYPLLRPNMPVPVAETTPTLTGAPALNGTPTQLWFDGGSRGNPGPAAAAYVLYDAGGSEIERAGEWLGSTTNNVAEYTGLVLGLKRALQLGARRLEIFSDSELVVKQLQGVYRVKHPQMVALNEQACELLARLDAHTVQHVPRSRNALADGLVNETLDAET